MATALSCPKCDSHAVRYSRRHIRDGPLRMLFCSAFRCNACGHRYFRFNAVSLAVVAALLLLLAILVVIGQMVLTHYE